MPVCSRSELPNIDVMAVRVQASCVRLLGELSDHARRDTSTEPQIRLFYELKIPSCRAVNAPQILWSDFLYFAPLFPNTNLKIASNFSNLRLPDRFWTRKPPHKIKAKGVLYGLSRTTRRFHDRRGGGPEVSRRQRSSGTRR